MLGHDNKTTRFMFCLCMPWVLQYKIEKVYGRFYLPNMVNLWLNRKSNYRKVIQTSFQISITSSSLRAVVFVNAFQTIQLEWIRKTI